MLGMASRRRRRRTPGVFVQEAHGDVEGGAAPHFQAVQIVQPVRDEVGDRQHVVGAHARGQQRLVGIAEGGVGEQQALLRRRPRGEASRARGRRSSWRVPCRRRRHGSCGGTGGGPNARRAAACRPPAGLPLTIDFAEIGEQLGGAVLPRRELEQRGRLVEERRGDVARPGSRGWLTTFSRNGMLVLTPRMRNSRRRAVHALAGVAGIRVPQAVTLHQQRIVDTGVMTAPP